jgi:hypothetical protein
VNRHAGRVGGSVSAADRRRRPARAGGRWEAGQATVEVALILPVVVALALGVVQVGVIVHDQVLVTAAAREAVRAVAVSGLDDDGRRAAGTVGGLDPGRLDLDVRREAGPDGGIAPGAVVRVVVRYTVLTDVPLIGPALPDVVLSATAAMRDET